MSEMTTDYLSGMKTGRPARQERTPFGERVAQARESAGLTQQQLAEKLDSTQRVIAYWEREPVALRAEQLAALAEALHVSADFLLGREDKLPSPKGPPGRLRQLFEQLHQLPRSQQNKIVAILQPFVREQSGA